MNWTVIQEQLQILFILKNWKMLAIRSQKKLDKELEIRNN